MTVEILETVELNDGRVLYAPAVRAGRWLFMTGHMATDHRTGLLPEVLCAGRPHTLPPRHEREGRAIFDRLGALLEAAGSSFDHVVRVDQYYRTWRAVDPYHRARKAAFGGYVAPSTSIIAKDLLLPQADMDVQMIAVMPGTGLDPRRIARDDLIAPATSGYSPALCAGDFVFVAGQLARDASGLIPDAAKVPAEQLWRGTRITLETDYLIRERLAPTLEAAGCSLHDIVKAQVYLADPDDVADFLQVWNRHVGDAPPALSVLPAQPPCFGTRDARIEINALALAGGGTTRKVIVDASGPPALDGQPGAVRAGDLLFLSGLMAADEDGLAPAARIDPRQPHFGSSIEAQMEHILEQAAGLCARAGTSLDNVVRVQQFHTDLREFYPAYRVWRSLRGERALPFSAVEVPAPLPIPGASVAVDMWVYVP